MARITKTETGEEMVTFSIIVPRRVWARLRKIAADRETLLVPFVREILTSVADRAAQKPDMAAK